MITRRSDGGVVCAEAPVAANTIPHASASTRPPIPHHELLGMSFIHPRIGSQKTPTAVHASVTAHSAALPAPNKSRADWIVAARARENVASAGSIKVNAR